MVANKIIMDLYDGNNAFELIKEVITPALERIGSKWANGDIALSQEYMASRISEDIVDSLLPPESSNRRDMPVIGLTTLGDEHMLGKRILASFLKASGFKIHDYGDMKTELVAQNIKKDGVDVIMVSVLMLNLVSEVRELRSLFDREGIDTKILVGGAPFLFDRDLWKEVGADSMASDAMESFEQINSLMGIVQ
ncbi:MAG: cobalamin B12-binding protein [Methanolobus sp. T82-4]|nr:MAG: cobalamin B12-binding protein [Methanolobus sp. T82-4]